MFSTCKITYIIATPIINYIIAIAYISAITKIVVITNSIAIATTVTKL